MIAYFFQVILLITVISFTIAYMKNSNKFVIVSVVLSCILSIVSIALDLYKLYLVNKDFNKFKDMELVSFGIAENVLNSFIICLILAAIVGVGINLKKNRDMKFFSKLSENKVNIFCGILFIISVFGISFFMPDIIFESRDSNIYVEEISNLEIVSSEDKQKQTEKAISILEKIETDFLSNDVSKWLDALKACEYVELGLVDENIEVFNSYDSGNIIHKYVNPIANSKQRKQFSGTLYSNGPELGIYDIIELSYFEIGNRNIVHNTAVIVYGITNREYSLDNIQFKEKAVYIYILKENIKLNLFWINLPGKRAEYYYIYEFLDD